MQGRRDWLSGLRETLRKKALPMLARKASISLQFFNGIFHDAV
jgi:hypothetical protein